MSVNLYKQRLTHKFTTAYGFSEPFMGSPKPTVENLWITTGVTYEKTYQLIFDCLYYYSFLLIYPENKEKLTISNLSENENDKITAVYTRLYETDDWILQWQNDVYSLAVK